RRDKRVGTVVEILHEREAVRTNGARYVAAVQRQAHALSGRHAQEHVATADELRLRVRHDAKLQALSRGRAWQRKDDRESGQTHVQSPVFAGSATPWLR